MLARRVTRLHPRGCLLDLITEYRVLGFRLGGCGIYILSGCFLFSSKGIGAISEKTVKLFIMLNSKRLGS